jgi:hypothetical protein
VRRARLADRATRAAAERMLDRLLETAREAHADLTGRRGVPPSRLCPGGSQEHFGFRDAVGGVVIEGARPRSPIKAGEFLLASWTGRAPTANAAARGAWPKRDLRGAPRFVITRSGEYLFIPGIRALQWSAEGQ